MASTTTCCRWTRPSARCSRRRARPSCAAGYSLAERLGARPTLDLNGLWGGFQGEGIKTAIPSEAHAKLTCRLVAAQEPATIRERLVAHIRRHTPPGVTVRFHQAADAGGAQPYQVPANHPGNRVAQAVLGELGLGQPVYTRLGGSVPVCDLFRRTLGASTIFYGFGRDDEGQHAPNEFLRLANFELGQVGYARLLERLGEMTPEALRGSTEG